MGAGNQMTSGEMGPQSPAVEKNGQATADSGIAFEVFSFNDQGQRKRHQVWRDRQKAYGHLAQLKKLYGHEIKAGIREIRDVKGTFSQSVRKCFGLLKASYRSQAIGKTKSGKPIGSYAADPQHADFSSQDHADAAAIHSKLHAQAVGNSDATSAKMHLAAATKHRDLAKPPKMAKAAPHMPPVTARKVGGAPKSGIVTGAGAVKTGKSPKVTGAVNGKHQLGTTKSGKAIHNDPGHASHSSFSAADHMDAYRAHAKQVSTLDAKETHPSIIEHHKQALNTHYKMGVSGGMKKAVAACRALLKA